MGKLVLRTLLLFLTACVQANSVKAMTLDEPMTLLAKGEEFTAIYHPHMASQHRGTLIFFSPLLDPVGAKAGFAQLRIALSNKGYDSFLVVNNVTLNSDQERNADTTTSDDPATPSSNDETPTTESTEPTQSQPTPSSSYVPAFQLPSQIISLDDYKSQLLGQLEAVMDKASEQQKPISVFAVGQSAGLLSEYFTDYPDIQLQALITLNVYLPVPDRNRHIGANLSIIAPSVLDIRDTSASSWSLALAQQSLRWSGKNQKLDYRQLNLLDEIASPQQLARVSQEIDGFLRRLF